MAKNIYKIGKELFITSEEEIKEGDYFLEASSNSNYYISFRKSIPIKSTTNYASNKYVIKIILTTDQDLINDGVQAIDDKFLEWFVKNPSCEEIEISHHVGYTQTLYFIVIPKEETKQETLEEVAERLCPNKQVEYDMFIEGAKWQKERSYSEEDMREAFIAGGNSQIEEDDAYGSEYIEYMEEWFEQFKKK